MLKPKALEFGDTIGVIAPSSPAWDLDMEEVINTLKNIGFNAVLGKSCYETYGYLAGKDDIRANDINTMFEDDNIDGIICLRGGYGTPRILDKLNYDIINKNPKVFVGYSDITAIHTVLNNKSGIVTFHGPMVSSNMIDKFDEFSKRSLFNTIMNTEPIGRLSNPNEEQIKTLVSGKTKGNIVGGNLALIASTIGTPYEIDTKNKILFLEDIGEEPFSIDRMLTQLYHSGKLQDANGIVLGDWADCTPIEHKENLTLLQIFDDIIGTLKKPTIYNFKSGHCSPMITIPFGVEAYLDGERGSLYISEGAVI
ncbi:S66 peptidase family protein [Clostridiisalibacter paucivorans]|uniref:S66 peptidase family protein n=1 Tax=Clostridiisalibacter paucivorans TaxID=408753 RepID=UPI00047BCA46|nr:LD-carboxypeptidase [Clostridiisalibacter paucivorans]